MSRASGFRDGGRFGARLVTAVAVVAVLAAIGWTAPLASGANETTPTDPLACGDEGDGVVFRTDGGLEVAHPGQAIRNDPFVNETTLSFSNVTVAANGNASVVVESATDSRLCVAAVEPTDAALELTLEGGPTVVVVDALDALTVGSLDYTRAATGVDLSYSARTEARIRITDADLQPGRAVEVVDDEDRSVLATGRVGENGTLSLRLPAGTRAVGLQFASSDTPAAPPGSDPTETESVPTDETDSGQPDGSGTNTGDTGDPTPHTATPTPVAETPPANATAPLSFAWVDDVVDYQPTPQTQHVGGFLPLTVLLWLLALLLSVSRRTAQSRLLGVTLVAASVRATSDLLQVVLDGFVGVEAPLASINLLLEVVLAVSFVQFTAVYVGEDRLRTRSAKAGLGAVVVLAAAAIATNPMHRLVFVDVGVASGPFTYVTATAGPGGWALFVLNMCLVVASGGLLLRAHVGPSLRAVWRPVAVVGAGLFLAVAMAVVSALGEGPVPGYDYTAAGVNYFILLTAVTVAGHGLHRLKTSGRKSVVDELEDAVVILDDAWVVVEYNAAAERLLPGVERDRSLDAALPEPLARPSTGETNVTELSLPSTPASVSTRGTTLGSGRGPTGARVDRADDTPNRDESTGRSSRDPLADVAEEPSPDDDRDADAGGRDRRTVSSDAAPERGERDGDRKHFIVKATTVTTETNAVIGYTIQFTDVTDLKRQMQRLEAKNAQLDRFASAITEDLRTPLAEAVDVTDRAIDVLESARGPEAVDRSRLSRHFGQIHDALDRMSEIIDDILGLARGSDIETDPYPVEFDRIVESAWDAVGSPGATLRIESSGGITADPEHLQRLLEQLFSNAVEHAGEGVTISVGLSDSGFYVRDDGPGVPAEVRDELFDAGATTKDDGSGLGLAIAEQRARAHGWEIGLGADHDGAQFVVTGCDTTPGSDASLEVNG